MIKKARNLQQSPNSNKQKQNNCAHYTDEIKLYFSTICCIINSTAKLIII